MSKKTIQKDGNNEIEKMKDLFFFFQEIDYLFGYKFNDRGVTKSGSHAKKGARCDRRRGRD